MKWYCDSPEETAKNPDADRHLRDIAKGNQDAYVFLKAVQSFVHVLDDLVDRDVPVTIEQVAKYTVHFIEVISCNPFYLNNSMAILPHIISMFDRWITGEEWSKSESTDKKSSARVVRCGDVDLYLNAAYLVGGWDHLRAVKDARSYDEEN